MEKNHTIQNNISKDGESEKVSVKLEMNNKYTSVRKPYKLVVIKSQYRTKIWKMIAKAGSEESITMLLKDIIRTKLPELHNEITDPTTNRDRLKEVLLKHKQTLMKFSELTIDLVKCLNIPIEDLPFFK